MMQFGPGCHPQMEFAERAACNRHPQEARGASRLLDTCMSREGQESGDTALSITIEVLIKYCRFKLGKNI